MTTALRNQFGLVSAGAFPPHATLIGNLAIVGSGRQLAAALDTVFADITPFPVYNSGVVREHEHGLSTYRYDINLDHRHERPNVALNHVAAAVKAAVLPLSTPVEHLYSTPVADYQFAGHLGLASHELLVDGHLADEVGEFIAELPIAAPPAAFTARWYTLYEFKSAAWEQHWWETLTWRHLKSWRADDASVEGAQGIHMLNHPRVGKS